MKQIDVLLATFNGSKFLKEQLDSLLAQNDVDINLIVGDDGSQDSTIQILLTYKDKFHGFELHHFNRIGPGSNFLRLLTFSKADYFAFADQDDIWLPNHLSNSIERLRHISTPSLTFCSTLHIDSKSNALKMSKWPDRTPADQYIYITENFARGCTMVLNSEARLLILENLPKYFIMHDWWSLIVVLGCGQIQASSEVEVLYRIHNDNFIGIRKTNRKRLILAFRNILQRNNPILKQANELLSLYEARLNNEISLHLKSLKRLMDSDNIITKLWIVISLPRLRLRNIDNIALKLIFAVTRIRS